MLWKFKGYTNYAWKLDIQYEYINIKSRGLLGSHFTAESTVDNILPPTFKTPQNRNISLCV